MSNFDPKKLSVEFNDDVNKSKLTIPRRYTLTHSDQTAELFLTIGCRYDYDKLNAMRDEVLAEWILVDGEYYLYVYLYVDGQYGPITVSIRNMIFRKELPLALKSIRYGDRELFNNNELLDTARIIVYFNSSVSYYNKIEDWGSPSMYSL